MYINVRIFTCTSPYAFIMWCVIEPIFLLILDRVMKSLKKRGIQWRRKERLEDLDYADDICLLAQRFCDAEEKLKGLKRKQTELFCLLT